ncbi:MAG: hypothetical protein ACI9ON_003833, partial [Limisphaerales bacterium]
GISICFAHHSNPLRFGVSGKPGAVHLSGWQADLTRVLIKYPSIRVELLELVEGTHNPDYPIWEPLRDGTA